MDEVRLGSLTLQPRRQLMADGARVPLGRRALDIVSVLAEADGGIVTKDEMFAAVWPGVIVEENALQVHIVALRKALGNEANRLKTIRGVGYCLVKDDSADLPLEATAVPSSPGIEKAPEASPNTPPLENMHPAGALPSLAALAAAFRHRRRLAWSALALVVVLLGGVALTTRDIWSGQKTPIPVVVRPFTASAGGDSSERALADGITDELIVRLRRVPGLRVATAEPAGAPEMGIFKDAYVVDGSIRSLNDQVRITARLQRMNGEVLWSQTFGQRLADLFNTQEQIAASIAAALSVSFDVGSDSSKFGGTNNPEAYAAYLNFSAHQLDADQSIPVYYLKRAILLDPHYVKALNALSVSYGLQANYAQSTEEARALMAKMDAVTAQAVKADPNLWMSHVARGYFYGNNRQPMLAHLEFQRAAALDKGDDPALPSALAAQQLNEGRIHNAFASLDAAQVIDPIRRRDFGYVWALYLSGRLQDAIDRYNELKSIDPEGGRAVERYVGWAYLQLGKEDEALRIAKEQGNDFEDWQTFKNSPQLLGMTLAELRKWATGRYGDNGYLHETNFALLASLRGHAKLATDFLRLALERPVGGYVATTFWFPAMSNARKTADFKRIVTEQGLLEVWRKTGEWPDACRPISVTDFTCT